MRSISGPLPRPIRVLIIDDSVVARAVLTRILEGFGFQVVGQASGAVAALAVLKDARVDIILLDLEMPGIGGLDALPDLIAQSRGARVLVVSSACADGAASIMAALKLGAADTLLKPSAAQLTGAFAEELVDRLRRIAQSPPHAIRAINDARSPGHAIHTEPRRITCIGIGASTGGVPALAAFFSALPADVTVPILITQHLPAAFMPYYADQLREMTGRPTRLGAPGLRPLPGELLLAPGDAHMTLIRIRDIVHVRLERVRSRSGFLPSVDPMFASLGKVFGPGAVGVVLSGMGRDGAEGAEELVAAGGTVLAQDAATSVIWGMPGAVAEAGLAQAILPPDGIARRIARWSQEAPARWN